MKCLISFILCFFTLSVLAQDYLCDVLNHGQKITTLTGALPDNNRIANNSNDASVLAEPNTVLAYTLCQQAGFQLVNTQVAIPGLRGATNVSKIQQIPDPACTLLCHPIP